MTNYAPTIDGSVEIEPGVPLAGLRLGDIVLGLQDPDDLDAPRSTHVVTAVFGKHFVPTEDPTRFERFLVAARLERIVAGPRVEGVLTEGRVGPGLFAFDTTPVLDRVIF
jgi:hypothetical protein